MKLILASAIFCCILLFCISVTASAQEEPLGIALENFEYPHPVRYLKLNIQGENVKMAYMDVPAEGSPNGKTVILLHGKNFFGEYWKEPINFLTANGYRVLVPDQIGFGKSSKPDINYSFELLCNNTKTLLDTLGISKVCIIAHSMGGMVGSRFALMYPEATEKLIMENPIGLEDYGALVTKPAVEEEYNNEIKKTKESILQYHKNYYAEWKDEYGKYADVQYRMKLGGEYLRLARSIALTAVMIYEQPVVYDFPKISVPTLLIIGQSDRTAVGKDRASEEVKKTMGNYPELGKKTAAAIPGAKLVEIENCGHIPHFEKPAIFEAEVLKFLK